MCGHRGNHTYLNSKNNNHIYFMQGVSQRKNLAFAVGINRFSIEKKRQEIEHRKNPIRYDAYHNKQTRARFCDRLSLWYGDALIYKLLNLVTQYYLSLGELNTKSAPKKNTSYWLEFHLFSEMSVKSNGSMTSYALHYILLVAIRDL